MSHDLKYFHPKFTAIYSESSIIHYYIYVALWLNAAKIDIFLYTILWLKESHMSMSLLAKYACRCGILPMTT